MTEFVVFETNHPYVTERVREEMSEAEQLHLASRMLRRYYDDRDWIEKGFQHIKPHMMRTHSYCPRMRFFCFHFGAFQFSVWQLLTVLALFAVREEFAPNEGPKVQFSTLLGMLFESNDGLDPPS